MSGVIDNDGQQWERCNVCGRFVKIETLWYEDRSEKFSCGRDVCSVCVGNAMFFGAPKLMAKVHANPTLVSVHW